MKTSVKFHYNANVNNMPSHVTISFNYAAHLIP